MERFILAENKANGLFIQLYSNGPPNSSFILISTVHISFSWQLSLLVMIIYEQFLFIITNLCIYIYILQFSAYSSYFLCFKQRLLTQYHFSLFFDSGITNILYIHVQSLLCTHTTAIFSLKFLN